MAEVKITVKAVPDTSYNVRNRASPGGIPPINMPPELRRAEQEAKKLSAERQKMFQGLSFLAAPIANPTSLWGNLLSGVAIQRALSTRQGQRILGGFGMAGAGGTALASAGIVGVAAAVGVALKALHKTITETVSAIQRASRLFVFKGMSGFSDTYASQRFTAANVIGVSTDEVMRFGAAMNQLNPQLKHANENFARTYRTLTYTSYQWKIMQTNIESMFATIANSAAPAINKFARGMSNLVTTLDNLFGKHPVLARLVGAGLAAPFGAGAAVLFGGGGDAGKAAVGPTGQVPKRSSAWERMGLVVGGPMGSDRTIDLLRAQLRLLGRIHAAIRGGVPRGAQPLNPHFNLIPNLPRS